MLLILDYISCLHSPRRRHHHLPRSSLGAIFVCVGCTVLCKSHMLMQQKAAEHYVEWTNFRSAWPRFITAHKPKVSCVRWGGKSDPCTTRIIYHPTPFGALFDSSCSFLSAVHMQFWTSAVIHPSQFLFCHTLFPFQLHISLYLHIFHSCFGVVIIFAPL